jgi:hypothetical protein
MFAPNMQTAKYLGFNFAPSPLCQNQFWCPLRLCYQTPSFAIKWAETWSWQLNSVQCRGKECVESHRLHFFVPKYQDEITFMPPKLSCRKRQVKRTFTLEIAHAEMRRRLMFQKCHISFQMRGFNLMPTSYDIYIRFLHQNMTSRIWWKREHRAVWRLKGISRFWCFVSLVGGGGARAPPPPPPRPRAGERDGGKLH